jgi:hypothetical protein
MKATPFAEVNHPIAYFPKVSLDIAFPSAEVVPGHWDRVDVFYYDNWLRVISPDESEEWWYPRDSGIFIHMGPSQ